MAYRRGMDDGLGNSCWLGQMPAGVEPAQSGSSTEACLLIGAFAGDRLEIVGGNRAPIGGDGSGLDQDHIDAEGTHFNTQGVAEGFKGVLGGMIPGTHISDHSSCHG